MALSFLICFVLKQVAGTWTEGLLYCWRAAKCCGTSFGQDEINTAGKIIKFGQTFKLLSKKAARSFTDTLLVTLSCSAFYGIASPTRIMYTCMSKCTCILRYPTQRSSCQWNCLSFMHLKENVGLAMRKCIHHFWNLMARKKLWACLSWVMPI